MLRHHICQPPGGGHHGPKVPDQVLRPPGPGHAPCPAPRAPAQDRQPPVHNREDYRVGAQNICGVILQLQLGGGEQVSVSAEPEAGLEVLQWSRGPLEVLQWSDRRRGGRGLLRQTFNLSHKQY